MSRYTGDWSVRPERILSLDPIEGADKIEVATVKGWKVVCKKGEFKVGDFGLFFPIDSLLNPEDPRFSFMKDRNFRVKTIKLKGQISQGLLLPLSLFPEVSWHKIPEDKISSINFAGKFKVKKYEDPILAKLGGSQEGHFPFYVPKTDQERIQNVPEVRSYGGLYELTEKLDGTSFTAVKKDELIICSRNWRMKLDDSSVYSFIAKKYNLQDKLPVGYAIQGEIIGPGIQKNRYHKTEPELYLFDVFSLDKSCYLDSASRLDFVKSTLNHIPHVPILETSKNVLDFESTEAILDYADGMSVVSSTTMREGIVFKCLEYHNNNITSFKAISRNWLLKYE